MVWFVFPSTKFSIMVLLIKYDFNHFLLFLCTISTNQCEGASYLICDEAIHRYNDCHESLSYRGCKWRYWAKHLSSTFMAALDIA